MSKLVSKTSLYRHFDPLNITGKRKNADPLKDIFLGGDIHDIFGTIAKQEAKDRNLQLQEEQEAAAQAKKQIAQQLANQVKAANVGQVMRKGGKVKSKSYKHGGKLGCGAAIKGFGKGPYKKKGM
jgi:hypothetical protein